jgi:hypothetical protein
MKENKTSTKNYKAETTSVYSARFTKNEVVSLYKLRDIMRKGYGCGRLSLSDVLRNCFYDKCKEYKILND